MKSKFLSFLTFGIMFLGIGLFATSCSDDFEETAWDIQNYEIKESQWSWNPASRRWEATVQLKYIDEFIYESGSVIGYVFLGQQNVNEVQTQLPYSESYIVDGEKFTETISYVYSHLTNKVTFYITPSDGVQDSAAKANYQFRIVMIW